MADNGARKIPHRKLIIEDCVTENSAAGYWAQKIKQKYNKTNFIQKKK